jgi:hypothetical protein
MRENTSCWLRALPAALFLLLLAGAASAALTVVRLREEVSHLATTTAQLQATTGETTRLLQEMGAAVAAAQQPEVLRARVGTRLAPMSEKQIVWVRAAGAALRAEGAAPPPSPTASFPRIATLEPPSGPGVLR